MLEAADAVGGRIRTDRVDGFLVDRGFQLLNPAYPAVRRWVDVGALHLQGFGAGVAAVTGSGTSVLGHPLRAPALLPRTAGTALGHPREVAAVLRWAAPLLRPRRRSLSAVLAGRADVDRGCRPGPGRRRRPAAPGGGPLPRRCAAGGRRQHRRPLRPAARLDVRPGRARRCRPPGMQALPEQLAAPLGDRVRLGHRVERVDGTPGRRRGPDLDGPAGGGRHRRAARPRPHRASTRPRPRAWSPRGGRRRTPRTPTCCTSTPGRNPRGPLVNAAVVSRAAPSYAPAGRHLVQGSALLGPGRVARRGRDAPPRGRPARASTRVAGRSWPGTRCPTRCPPSPRRTPRPARCGSATSSCAATTATPARSRARWSAASGPPTAVLAGGDAGDDGAMSARERAGPVVVVGAGLSGVACAGAARRRGGVRVLDRGHRPGGRMATRRLWDRPVDLGASYVTVSDDDFRAVVEGWQRRGLARPWTDTFCALGDGEPVAKTGPLRWGTPGGLRSLVEDLAADLDVERHEVADLAEAARGGRRRRGRAGHAGPPGPTARRRRPPRGGAPRPGVRAGAGPGRPLARAHLGPVSPTGRFEGAFVNGDPVVGWVADDGRRRGRRRPRPRRALDAGLRAPAPRRPGRGRARRWCRRCARCCRLPEPADVHVHRWTFARPVGERARHPRAGGRARRARRRSAATGGAPRPRSRPRGCPGATSAGPWWPGSALARLEGLDQLVTGGAGGQRAPSDPATSRPGATSPWGWRRS